MHVRINRIRFEHILWSSMPVTYLYVKTIYDVFAGLVVNRNNMLLHAK